jgi:hypothetical protein
MKNWQINRRTILRGLGGACLSLPILEVMGAESPKFKAPKRFVTMFMPNGVYPGNWNVKGEGMGFEFSPILEPLKNHKEYLSIISNIDNTHAAGHIDMTSSFLSGVARKNAKTPSVDQIIAQTIGRDNRLQSLIVGTEPPRGGKIVASTVSWSSKSAMITPELNPQTAFDTMFRDMSTPEAKAAMNRRRSVIDLVLNDAKDLNRKISKADKHKLDEYISGVREVEKRIENIMKPQSSTGKWSPKTKPTANDLKRPGNQIPKDRNIHMDLLIDLIVLGLWTDTTRVGTLMMGHGFSRKSFTFLDTITDDHHTMSHHKENDDKVRQYTRVSKWHIEKMAQLVGRLKAIPEGNGNLLDNSLVLFGSGMKDGNGHNKKSLPLVIAGKAGGNLIPGGHISEEVGTRFSNLHVSVLNAMGIPTKQYGASDGPLKSLKLV